MHQWFCLLQSNDHMAETFSSDAEVQQLSALAVDTAREKFGVNLDFSASSLSLLEPLLSQARQRFNDLNTQGALRQESVSYTAKVWGIYLGEVVRRNKGGNWVRRDGDLALNTSGSEISPVKFVFHRITDLPDYSAVQFYSEIITSSQSFRVQESQSTEFPTFDDLSNQERPSSQSKQKRTKWLVPVFALILTAIAAIVLLA